MSQTVNGLFRVRYGQNLELNRMVRAVPPAGVNFVGRAMRNNGVTARVLLPAGVVAADPGELSVALGGNGVLSTYVQPEPFVTGRDVAILTPIDGDMPTAERLWWARCILANRYRHSYGRQANRSLGSLVLPEQVPDFVHVTRMPDLDRARQPQSRPQPLPALEDWSEWRLDALFDVLKGRRLTRRQRRPGGTPYIAASMRNNGLVGQVDLQPALPTPSITVPYNGNGVAYAFVQRIPFCASDDVQVLVPKTTADVGALLFVCSVIRGCPGSRRT